MEYPAHHPTKQNCLALRFLRSVAADAASSRSSATCRSSACGGHLPRDPPGSGDRRATRRARPPEARPLREGELPTHRPNHVAMS